MQNKPNFRPFRPKNDDFTKKQTQFKPNSNPIQSQTKPILAQKLGGQTQTNPICLLFYSCVLSLVSLVFFCLIYICRILNWIKSSNLLKIVQNCLYQYKKTCFYSCNDSRPTGINFKKRGVIIMSIDRRTFIKSTIASGLALSAPAILKAQSNRKYHYFWDN